MKYLDYPELEALSRALTFESTECKVFTRLEAYSCKAVNKEKRLYKALESAYQQSASTSPPHYLEEALSSPFGRLDQPTARKTLFLLIALLNGAFPDHDFSQVNPSDFRKEPSPAMVLHSLSSTLHSLRSDSGGPRSYTGFPSSFEDAMRELGPSSTSLPGGREPGNAHHASTGVTHAGLASLLDDIMDIRDCEVFTFHPDVDSDPHACVEPEEEGFNLDDDPASYWSEDDDIQMQSVNVVTPPRTSPDLDAPMFDEDFSGGFKGKGDDWPGVRSTISGAYADSDGPHTPSSGIARLPGSAQQGRRQSRTGGADFYTSSSLSSASSLEADDDDVDGTGGLLWSTYAFFYNRRLKRMLFVSVWSRMNSALSSGAGWTSPLTAYEPALTIPTSLKLPSSMTSPKNLPKSLPSQTRRNGGANASSHTTPNPSPAKLALSRSARGRRRAASGSPAPSSLSPFPHASPRGAGHGSGEASTASTTRANTPSVLSTSAGPLSLDAAAVSISAPASSAGNRGSAVSAAASKRASESSEQSGKRTRRQVAV